MAMIYVIAITIVLLALAKRGASGGKRPMGRYIRGSVDEEIVLGTLAARSLVVSSFDETVNERTLVSSIVASWSLDDWTLTSNAGPILVGVAHGDYTAAEIEAVIENTGSWNEGDLVSREVGNRKVRIIGTFRVTATGEGAVLNHGRPIKTKLNWILNQGQTLDAWAYNLGSAAVATTDPSVHIEGHANLWPR